MKPEQARILIENKFNKLFTSDRNMINSYLLIHSDRHNIHWNMAVGQTGDTPAGAEQPYHTASIGKAFTAVIIAMLAEEGKLRFSDPIETYLPEDILNGLHTYKGKDYSRELRIEHLVNNTSGLPDYYEEKTREGKTFLQILTEEPSRVWKPEEPVAWSKQHLKPRFAPGGGCYYNNTGFNLLGLIIEQITGKPYHEVLHEYIFQRLHMDHSYLSQYSEPAVKSELPVANIYALNQIIKVEDHRSFSSVYAAGQTVSTSEDLLAFMKALTGGQLIRQESLNAMHQWRKMWLGIDYGYGLMRVRMHPFTRKYDVWGHLGSIGSFMLYNPGLDVYVIGNFNKGALVAKSIRFVFNALRTVEKSVKSI